MMDRFPVSARVAASDIARARAWYADKLGATPQEEEMDGLWYRFGDDTWLFLFQTPMAGTAQNTVAGWAVTGIEDVMTALRSRGVVFEDYDFGEVQTVDGLLAMGNAKAAWFKDSEGNVCELTERT